MNIILDIDETFVQYVGHADWKSLAPEEQKKYETDGGGPNGLFILRPHFDEFFTYLFENAKTVNLWTWSDKEYAKGVAELIQKKNPKWTVTNVWSCDDVDASIDMYDHNKDLNYIWYKKKVFKPCNTILVDDLPENTNNPSNKRNGIQIPPFHPLGEKLSKEDRKACEKRTGRKDKIRTGEYTDMSKDNTLQRVVDVLKEAAENPEFCKEGDLPHPFETHVDLTKPAKGGRRRRRTRRDRKRRATRKYRR